MSSYTNEFDPIFVLAAGLYVPQWAWQYVKAESIAESALDPKAVSRVGAQGLMQFMPATWPEARRGAKLAADASPFDPAPAILAGAWYLGHLRAQWKAPRSEADRRKLAQASYNAGIGNILKAQKLANGAADYASIIARLPEVTGAANAHETTTYVDRIERIYLTLA
jgi:membrane-bound lytic murein transglycosylase F